MVKEMNRRVSGKKGSVKSAGTLQVWRPFAKKNEGPVGNTRRKQKHLGCFAGLRNYKADGLKHAQREKQSVQKDLITCKCMGH